MRWLNMGNTLWFYSSGGNPRARAGTVHRYSNGTFGWQYYGRTARAYQFGQCNTLAEAQAEVEALVTANGAFQPSATPSASSRSGHTARSAERARARNN